MAEQHSPLHQFEIQPLIPFELGGVNLAFTNSSLWMLVAAALSIAFMMMATAKPAMVPGRLQVAAEGLYSFIANMVRENTGTHGMHYFPFIFTLFMVVFLGNGLGMIPFSFTYTSHIIVTAAMALVIFLMVVGIGLYRHGAHFLSLFVPPGVPLPLYILIVPIEIISFLVRPITLSVRLFANMMAGHIMLKVIAGLSVGMVSLGAVGIAAGFVPALFNTVLMALEFLIAFLQAYVFTILTCVYLKDTVEIEH